jgi:RNA recognition motif-containing protein
MAKKLYVGNLSWNTTADSLKDIFSKAGTVVSANLITDKMTGKSRGFGFVEMEDADADAAVEMFNGKEVDGRTLTVNEARPMTDRPRRSFDNNRGGDRQSY